MHLCIPSAKAIIVVILTVLVHYARQLPFLARQYWQRMLLILSLTGRFVYVDVASVSGCAMAMHQDVYALL